jgi:hypothetical protein
MNDDLTDRLRDLPPELPDVTDRLARVRRLVVRRRRRQVGLAAVATAIAVAVPVTVVAGMPNGSTRRPTPHATPSKLRAVATDCPHPGLSVMALPPSVRPTHSTSQVRAVFRRHAGTITTIVPAYVEDPVASKLGLGEPTRPRLMWVVSLLTRVDGPGANSDSGRPAGPFAYPNTRVASLSLVDDATLKLGGNFACQPINSVGGIGGHVSGYGIAAGTSVGVTGSIGPAGTGFVLCFLGGSFLGEPSETEPVCADQVALVGMTGALAKSANRSRYVTGIWQTDGLHVTRVSAPRDDDAARSLTTPPCANPAGGWATVASSPTPNVDLTAFEHYKSTHPGVVATIAIFRPSNLQLVLTIASTDPAATKAALDGSYPRALCVVRSRFTEAQLHRSNGLVKQAFLTNRLPGASAEGSGVDSQGQPTIDLTVLNDRPEIHRVLADVTPGLLRIDPWLHILAPGP